MHTQNCCTSLKAPATQVNRFHLRCLGLRGSGGTRFVCRLKVETNFFEKDQKTVFIPRCGTLFRNGKSVAASSNDEMKNFVRLKRAIVVVPRHTVSEHTGSTTVLHHHRHVCDRNWYTSSHKPIAIFRHFNLYAGLVPSVGGGRGGCGRTRSSSAVRFAIVVRTNGMWTRDSVKTSKSTRCYIARNFQTNNSIFNRLVKTFYSNANKENVFCNSKSLNCSSKSSN